MFTYLVHILLVQNTNDVNLKPVQIFPRKSFSFGNDDYIYIYSMTTANYVQIYIYIQHSVHKLRFMGNWVYDVYVSD